MSLIGFMDKVYGVTIGFGQWILIGVPVTLITLFFLIPTTLAAMWLLGPLVFGVRFDILPDLVK